MCVCMYVYLYVYVYVYLCIYKENKNLLRVVNNMLGRVEE